MKLHGKLHCCVLTLAMTLVTTCAMGGDQKKVRKLAVEAMAHRNEVEENWHRESGGQSVKFREQVGRVETNALSEQRVKVAFGTGDKRNVGDGL